jgi:LacI family transcriptional regulator
MLTQKELAKRIGVSQQAISFALNGGGTLKQATREYIIEEARKAGYRVNGASRLFREGRTNSIALIVQGNFHTLPRLMLSALRLALREKEMHLTLYGAEKEDFADPQNPAPARA